jgi:hypothetical protein
MAVVCDRYRKHYALLVTPHLCYGRATCFCFRSAYSLHSDELRKSVKMQHLTNFVSVFIAIEVLQFLFF